MVKEMIKEMRKGKEVLSKIKSKFGKRNILACNEMWSQELNIITLTAGHQNCMGRCLDEKFWRRDLLSKHPALWKEIVSRNAQYQDIDTITIENQQCTCFPKDS